jgi:[ribosomal protein S5]-alanine N-acetyltransferase
MSINIPINIDGIKLRPFEAGDEISLAENANYIAIWNMVRDRFPFPYTISDAKNWIQICSEVDQPKNFAIVNKYQVIGGIGIVFGNDIDRISAEIGYWLAEPFWNNGIISNSISLFLNYVFDAFPDLNRVFASVFPYNHASIRVLQKVGFRQEGVLIGAIIKNNQIYDSPIFGITRNEWLLLNSNK